MPNFAGRQRTKTSRMDYHDLKLLELEQAAEEHLKAAWAAFARGELAARKEVQRWTITLDNIRQLKASVTRLSSRAFSGYAR